MAEATRFKDLQEAQKKLDQILHAESMKRDASEEKLQEQIDGISSSMTEKMDHLARTLADMQLQLLNMNRGSYEDSDSVLGHHHTSSTGKNSGSKMRMDYTHAYVNAPAPRIEFPKFDGSNPRAWVLKCNSYFKIITTLVDYQKINLASMNFEGKALQWFQNLDTGKLDVTWVQFVDIVSARFEGIRGARVIVEFNKLKQTGTYADYVEKFEELKSCMLLNSQNRFSEEYFVASFISGLSDELQSFVGMFKPTTLEHAIELGEQQTVTLDIISKRMKPVTRTYSSPPSNYKKPGFNNQTRSLPSPILQPPTQLLTPAQMEERMKKKLCYNCDEQFTPGHRCKNRISYVMMTEEEELSYMPTEQMVTDPQDSTEVPYEEVHISIDSIIGGASSTQEPAGGECSQPISSSRNGISDLEQLLKQKTFSRSEIDHLTTLLHSRGGEVSLRDDGKRNEETVSDFGRLQTVENGMEEDRSPRADSKVIGDSIASPSELAKAYMGNRPSNSPQSMLGNHSQVTRDDTKMLSSMRTKPVSMSLTTKSAVSFGSPGNGYITNRRSLGRSAIYNMARTPQSKRTGINHNGYAGLSVPSTSLTVLENCEQFEPNSKPLKRRSFVLDDDLGSVGPIRRIRQKSNLIAHGVPHTDRVGSKSDAKLVSSKQKLPLIDVDDNTDVSNPSTSYAILPFKSNGSEVAVGRVNGKSSEANVVSARQKSTFKLTPSMLHGQALRSMEDATSSELLLNVQDNQNFESSAGLLDTRVSTPQDQGKVEENGPLETSSPSHTYYPVKNSDSAVSFEASLVRGRTSDDFENGLSQPQNKAAFRMSALEDYVDLDDDVPCIEFASCPSSDGRGSLEAHCTDSKFSRPEEPKLLETTIQTELKSRSDLISSKTNETSSAGAASLGERSNGIITSASIDVTAAARPSIPPPSFAAFNNAKEMNDPPSLFNFNSKVADKFPSLMPESSTGIPESSSSLLNVFATSSSPVTFSEPGKGGYLKPLAAEDTNGKSDTAASNGLLGSGSPAVSLTATSNNNTHPISTATPAIFTSSVSISDFIPSGTDSVSAANSGRITFGASETPKVSGEPAFKFGASPDPSTNVSAASTTIVPAGDLKNEAVTHPSSGSTTTNFVSFGIPSSGNMTSGLSSSTSNPSANNSQGSLFGGASKSFVPAVGTVSQGGSTQSNLFASNTSSSTPFASSLSSAPAFGQVMPFGVNSSASSSDTGVVASSSGSTSSLFGVNPIAVSNGSAGGSSSFTTSGVFSFGASSSSSSINAVGSTGGATAPVFGAGLSSSGSASVTTGSFSSAPSSTGGAAAPVFSFGATSSGSASATTNSFGSSSSLTTAVGSTGGAAPSAFSFGLSNPASASAPTAASSFSNGASGVFSFGGSAPASSSAINSVNSNNAPNPFGASSVQAPASSLFGSSPASGFSFGAQPTSSAPPSSSPFSFSSAPASVFSSPSPSLGQQPVFGNPGPGFAASSPGNSYQMNGEDSMAEDPVQSTAPSPPAFGQANNISPSPPGFMFGSAAPSQPNPFQFGGQQNQAAPQNPSMFQSSSSLEFNAGGSFSLGSAGVDKSGRKYVKVNRSKNRKK